MNHTAKLVMVAMLLFAFCACAAPAADDLAKGFSVPAESVRPCCYWWWLNGYITREGIVRDLDEMRTKGINGVLVFNAGGGPTPQRTEFMSPEWRTLFRFAVEEAARRNMVVGLNLCDGWNAGGPWVKPEDAAKTLVYSTLRVTGPQNFSGTLPKADKADKTYRDTMELA
jgi:hypothetical protein